MVDAKLTARLAELAKIEFTDTELDKMAADMKGIIALMDKACEFDGGDMPYTQDMVGYDELRADESVEWALLQAECNRFKVPKVV